MLWRWLRILKEAGKLGAEVVQGIPLLEALEANDYQRAAEEFLGYGSVQDRMAGLSDEQRVVLMEVLPLVMQTLDEIIPEEKLLSLLEALGLG